MTIADNVAQQLANLEVREYGAASDPAPHLRHCITPFSTSQASPAQCIQVSFELIFGISLHVCTYRLCSSASRQYPLSTRSSLGL